MVFTTVATFIIAMLIVLSGCSGLTGQYPGKSGQSVYIAKEGPTGFQNVCVVNMTADRKITDMNADFLECYENYLIDPINTLSLSSTKYMDGYACYVTFSDRLIDQDANELWVQCTFDHIEWLAREGK